ncbi:MAG: NIPSNAP family protein, partial [Bacteroidetes bacterium]|nr:NIPSNAP family protein [Bacteroidota bacterium]
MKRRHFLKASILTGTVAGLAPHFTQAAAGDERQKKTKQEFYELREYSFTDAGQQKLVEDYYEKAAIPALNRMGSKHIGVFREQNTEEEPRLFVLIPFSSLEAFGDMRSTLDKDKAYQQAAAPYLQATAAAPAYARIQSSLMKSFAYLPKMEVPE